MVSTHDRRRFSRVPFHTNAIVSQDAKQWSCSVWDISLKGILVSNTCEGGLSPNSDIKVVVPLSDASQIVMTTQLAREEGDHLALECTEIDMDSITHLRRLLDLNLGDPEACHRELSILIEDALAPE